MNMKKIMVVDDDEDIRHVVKDLLESKGYNVVAVSDGDGCIQMVKKEKPDLILLDILMPGLPVDQLLPKIKDYKVVIFSVVQLNEKKVSETGKKIPSPLDNHNVIGYISKPFSVQKLLATVKKALN
jgi:CheY-like chemotaxis protein